jgi:predicted Zn-dependent peptidase
MGDWRLMDTFLKGIRKVNAQDVQAVAKRYLLDDSKTVGVLIPVKQGR